MRDRTRPFEPVGELDRTLFPSPPAERDPGKALPGFRPPLPKGIGGGGAAGAAGEG